MLCCCCRQRPAAGGVPRPVVVLLHSLPCSLPLFVCRGRGMLAWFAVHPVSMNNTNRLLSSDNKGVAAQGLENRWAPHQQDLEPGFTAAFPQTNGELYCRQNGTGAGNRAGEAALPVSCVQPMQCSALISDGRCQVEFMLLNCSTSAVATKPAAVLCTGSTFMLPRFNCNYSGLGCMMLRQPASNFKTVGGHVHFVALLCLL